jgi:nucleoside diphosphate kinase
VTKLKKDACEQALMVGKPVLEEMHGDALPADVDESDTTARPTSVKYATGAAAVAPPVDPESLQTTLAMIKPDAVAAGHTAAILAAISASGFSVLQKQEYTLRDDQVAAFYAEHAEKPFFLALKKFMTSGPTVALVLQRPGAIEAWRSLMGPTNSAAACERAPETLRAKYGTDGTRNAVHGSDSVESAAREIAFHFPEHSLVALACPPERSSAAAEADVTAAVTMETAVRARQASLKVYTAAGHVDAGEQVEGGVHVAAARDGAPAENDVEGVSMPVAEVGGSDMLFEAVAEVGLDVASSAVAEAPEVAALDENSSNEL